jgi:hypothetical protein
MRLRIRVVDDDVSSAGWDCVCGVVLLFVLSFPFPLLIAISMVASVLDLGEWLELPFPRRRWGFDLGFPAIAIEDDAIRHRED